MKKENKVLNKWGGLRKKGIFKKSLKDQPLISIITVVYNGDKYLEECFKSLYNQKYYNFEHIVIDGGSTDRTLEIIQKYENKIDFWSSEKDRGIYDAFNKGMLQAKGDYLGFLNSDDTYFSKNTLNYVLESFKIGDNAEISLLLASILNLFKLSLDLT